MIKDYNFSPPTLARYPRRLRLRWLIPLAGCVVIGVVAANGESRTPAKAHNGNPPLQRVNWTSIALPDDRADTAPALQFSTTSPPAPAEPVSTPDAGTAAAPDRAAPALAAPSPIDAVSETASETAVPTTADTAPRLHLEHTVGNGDTLSGIVTGAGFANRDVVALSRVKGAPWRALRPGQQLSFYTDAQGGLVRLVLHRSATRQTIFTRGEQGFALEHFEVPTETRQAYAHGVIRDSLFTAGRRAGVPDGLIMDLAYIFGWDIDFALDVRRGDQFTVIYEQVFRSGELLRVGNILAAEFVNRDRVYRAVRYTPASGRSDYYNPQGHSMRKAFLRSPLNFTRISSRFSSSRLHPKLHKIRAHRGVDYAAARGTPVWSTGDGKVVLRGLKGGFGKTVIINHGSRYSTLYAHLKGYGKGIRDGSRVKQGQVIGYVGTTGLSTGPHLHYEFRVNGTHRDPLRVKLPHAKPLPATEMNAFADATAPFWEQIALLKRSEFALASN